MIEAVRARVRLRTRLRRVREAWRSRFPQPLPAWSEPAPDGQSQRRATAVVDGRVTLAAGAASPRGRQRYESRQPIGRLSLSADPAGGTGWRVTHTPDGVTVVAGRVGSPLDDRQLAVIAKLGAVTCHDEPDPALAEVLAQLAVTGVVLHAPAVPAALLAPELAALLAAPLPAADADPMVWEIRSVRQRRAALRGHCAGLAHPPAVSALLVTKRPQLLAGAVATLAAQTYPNLEIVVGLHGEHEAPSSLDGAGRPVRVVPVPAARCLGEALAEASAAATGELVTKVDDDDHYGREHVWDLVMARYHSGATVVGKGSEFVYLEPKDLTVRRRMGAEFLTDTVAGGTIALSRDDLASVGGWPPVPRWVDRALLDQVIAAGGQVYRTHPIGFVYTRHGDGHTWDAGTGYFLRDPVRKWRGLPPYEEF
jgi:Glycosyl transferase family 2